MRVAAGALVLAVAVIPGLISGPVARVAQEVITPAATIRIGTPRTGSFEVSALPVESYIARVLAGEALPGSEPAALEALAIAIRTYAVANLGRHSADGFDLCDSTHCQVMRTASPQTERAARATAGQVLLYQGAPATIYYSASCGGRTELASAVWPDAVDVPYLPSRPDDGCGGDPVWRSEIALADLRRSFQTAGYRGTLRDLRVLSRNGSGRVARLALDGLTPSEVTGQDFRVVLGAALGWQHIRSTVFELRRERDAFRFEGRGFGHGVGMCVIGSAKLAVAGETASAILARYYPGTVVGPTPARFTRARPPTQVPALAPTLTPVSVPGVTVLLPGDDMAERELLAEIIGRARSDLATTLGVPAPAELRVRAYPTSDQYERATARPWFSFGAAINGEIHLLPVGQLRDRGILEQTIRRQVVHLLTASELARRPAWVREGAALYYAAAPGSDPAASITNLARDPCPTDADLLRPLSPGSLTTAYTQAVACFARQIAGGRTWRDVR